MRAGPLDSGGICTKVHTFLSYTSKPTFEKMNSLPSTADEALLRYSVDVARYVQSTRTRLLVGCKANRELFEVARVLRGDLLETIVFKNVCKWIETCSTRPPLELELKRAILFEISKELKRSGLGHLVTTLAKACQEGHLPPKP